MKKLMYCLLCSLMIVVCILPFVACGEKNPADYKQEDYFTFESSYLTGTDRPEKFERGCRVTAKSDVKIISISGKIWWDKSYHSKATLAVLSDTFETLGFVENVTIQKDTPKTFDFKATPESYNLSNRLKGVEIPTVLKAGETFCLWVNDHLDCPVTELKIEFVPA